MKLEGINLDFSTGADGAQTTAGRMRRKTTSLNLDIRSQTIHLEVTVILKINKQKQRELRIHRPPNRMNYKNCHTAVIKNGNHIF